MRAARQLRKPGAPAALLALAIVVSSALLLALGDGLTYFQDTWAFLLERRGASPSDFLRPHNEHISVIPVAIEKLLIEVFGMTSAAPERVVLTAMLAATAALVYVYVGRRLGAWPGLFAAVALLFLGPAWEVLLWPFEISLVGSLLSGVAMLLALERADRRGDLAACLLAVVSVGFSSLGVAFLAGAGADVIARRSQRGLGRAWVVATPLLLYAAWYLGYGRETESAASLDNLVHAPVFVAESIAAAGGSLLGVRAVVGGLDDTQIRIVGIAGLVLLAGLALYTHRRGAAAIYRRARDPGLSLAAWPAIASAAAFWLLAALNRIPGREPTTSRYLHIGATFLLLVLADLLRGARFRGRALAAAAAALAIATGANLVPLLEGHDTLEEQTLLARSELAAIEIAGDTVEPYFRLGPEIAGTPSLINVSAEPYLEATAEHGSPAYTQAELARAPEQGRRRADIVLASALRLEPMRIATPPPALSACTRLPGPTPELGPGPVAIALAPGPPATLLLRRFAGSYAVRLGRLRGGATTLLRIPRDRARHPWRLALAPDRPARVCSRPG